MVGSYQISSQSILGRAFFQSDCRGSLPGTFQNGIAEGEVDATFGPLEAMRLSVLTDSPVWVILSEVRPPRLKTGTRVKVCVTTSCCVERVLGGAWRPCLESVQMF